jgi:lysophospholipase L1-like esterase
VTNSTLPVAVCCLGLMLPSAVRSADEAPNRPRTFPANAAVYSGHFARVGVTEKTPYFQFLGADSTVELSATGTSLSVACLVASPASVEAQVDGGKWTDITPAPINARTTARVFAGLPDAPHVVTLRCKKSAHFVLDAGENCFSVTGKAPAVDRPEAGRGNHYLLALTKPDAVGRPGILEHVRAESGYGPDQIAGHDALRPLPQKMSAQDGCVSCAMGALFRFRASIHELAIWTYLDGSKYALAVDGKTRPVVQAPAEQRWGWLTLAADLEESKAHEYAVVAAFFLPSRYNLGSGAVHALRTRGGKGVDLEGRPAERPVLACYGDSITANQTSLRADADQNPEHNDATQGWIYRLGEGLGMATVNLGIGSTTVHDFGTRTGTVAPGGREYITTDTGEARTVNVTKLVPPPARVVVLYGTNDLGQAWGPSGAPKESLDEFAASYKNMLGKLVKGLPKAEIYCVGILPRSDVKAEETERWNEAIRAAVGAVEGRHTRHVDPRPWQLDGPAGKDYKTNFMDGLHPNALGRAILARELQKTMAPRAGDGPGSK